MRIITNNDGFTLFVVDKIMKDAEEIKKYLKDIVIKLKKRSKREVSGFYDVEVYVNKKFGMIFDFFKEDSFDFFQDIVDLDIKVHENAKIFLEFDDLFLVNSFQNIYSYNNKYYIDIDKISKLKFYSLLEFSNFIFGKDLEKIKDNLLVVKS